MTIPKDLNLDEVVTACREKAGEPSLSLPIGFPMLDDGFRRGELISMLFAVPRASRQGGMFYHRLTAPGPEHRVFMVSLETTPELARRKYRRYCLSADRKETEK